MKLLRATCLQLLVLAACSRQPPDGPTSAATTNAAPQANSATELKVVETMPLPGFEVLPVNDPEVRRMADGSLFVVFNCMPPCFEAKAEEWYGSLGPYAHFDEELQRAIGVDVVWEDREFFRILKPQPDTIAKLREFVARHGRRSRDEP